MKEVFVYNGYRYVWIKYMDAYAVYKDRNGRERASDLVAYEAPEDIEREMNEASNVARYA